MVDFKLEKILLLKSKNKEFQSLKNQKAQLYG
jgi:hypothetical protein